MSENQPDLSGRRTKSTDSRERLPAEAPERQRKRLTNSEAARLLLETGLLYEINRTLLHPLGLSLSVSGPSDGGGVDAQYDFAGIVDDRDDPEGTIFPPDPAGAHKLKAFYEVGGIARLRARFKALGYVVQQSKVYADVPPTVSTNGYDEESAQVQMQVHGGVEQPQHKAAKSTET